MHAHAAPSSPPEVADDLVIICDDSHRKFLRRCPPSHPALPRAEGSLRRWRDARWDNEEEEAKRPENVETTADGIVQFGASNEGEDESTAKVRASKRECPVPKPKGMLGELLGFSKNTVTNTSDSSQPRTDR